MKIQDYLEALKVPREYEDAFNEDLARRRVPGLWVLAVLGAILFPLFIGMDYLIRPNEVFQIGEVRFVFTCLAFLFIGALKAFERSPRLIKHSLALTWLFTVAFAAAINQSIILAGGLGTPYYAGLNLLIIVLATAIPLRTGQLLPMLIFLVLQINLLDIFFTEKRTGDLVFVANFHFLATAIIGILVNSVHIQLRLKQFKAKHQLEEEKRHNETLLSNTMPKLVAQELLEKGRYSARHIPSCTVLFSDFVGFTRLASRVSPSELVHGLDQAFTHFDDISARHGLERIKTMGDAYMCAGGVFDSGPAHLIRSVLAGLEMLDAVERDALTGPDGTPWRMRIGLHTGPVIAGVVGRRNFAFDLWGDAVNVASRLESHAQPGTINLMTETYGITQQFFSATDRGTVAVRGKGPVHMTEITRLRPRYSFDESGRLPNELFFTDMEAWLTEQGTLSPLPIPAVPEDTGIEVSVNQFDPVNAFAMLIPEDHERLRSLAKEVPIGEGEVLFREGQDLSVLYLIVRGLFAVRINRGGVDIEVAVLGSGELVGELSFVSLEAASATVVALADSAVLRFDLNRLQQMYTEEPGFSARLFHSFALRLARRVRIANAKLHTIGMESSTAESGGQDGFTSPHIPTKLVAAIGEIQRSLRPYMDGTKPEDNLPSGAVGMVCDKLISSLSSHAGTQPEKITELGTAIRREAYRFLMRSKLIQIAQGHGIRSHAFFEAVRGGHVLSNNPFGRQVEQWFHDQSFAQAISEAVQFVGDQLVESYAQRKGLWRMTLLGSGSVSEVFDRVGQLGAPSDLRITCVNDHIEALSAAGKAAEQLDMTDQLSLVRQNVLVRGMARSRLRLVEQDFIIFQALTVAVSDDAFLDLLDEVHALLATGGIFLLGQLHVPEDEHRFLEHVLDMSIASRPVDELSELARRSAFGSRFEWVTPGEGGLCSFLKLRREA